VDEATFDANVLEIKHTIDKAKGNPKNPFCVFKPTGIARFALLEKLDAGEKLDHDELAEYYRVVNRFDTICKAAFDNKVRLFVDAEETWIQKTLDSILNDMMEKYNKESVIVYNTVQLYRKGRVEFIQKCIDDAREKKYKLGFKLVRGAYLEKETERALKMNYPNPIQDTKGAYDTDYDAAVKLCFDNRDIVAICAGTHNEQSSMKLAELMAEAGVDKSDPHFWFAQLYGMSDNISFNLAAKGYNVAKYLPYGPLRYVMPYLGRRAKENSSMSGQMGRELSLIMTELKRRKLA
jgi:proline dehydrogenase